MKLVAKITTIWIVLMVLAIGSMLFIAIFTSQSELEAQIGDSQLQLTRSLMNEIDRTLQGALQDVKMMAEDEEFEGALAGREDFEKSVEKLKELELLTGPWTDLELFNTDGEVISSADRRKIGSKLEEHGLEEREALGHALKGEIYVSDLVLSEETGAPTVIFAAPIRNDAVLEQPIVGAVIAHFAWPVVLEILQNSRAEAHLYNGEGLLIGDSGKLHDGEILKQSLDSLGLHTLEGSTSVVSSLDARSGHPEVLISHVTQKGYLNYRGHGWVLVVETPTEVAFALVREVTWNLVIVGLLLLIVTVLVSFVVIKSIVKPINKLKLDAEKISRGNLGEKIVFKPGDEVGDLAETFDNMRYSFKMVVEEYEKMKGQAELRKSLVILQKKQTETIKNLKVAIAEQKLSAVAEQKALQKYREIEAGSASTYNLYHNILNNLSDAVAALDGKGKVVKSNTAFVKMLEYTDEAELIGKDVSNLHPKVELSKVMKIVKRILKGETVTSFESMLLTKKGKELPVIITASPMKDKEGKVIGVVGILRRKNAKTKE